MWENFFKAASWWWKINESKNFSSRKGREKKFHPFALILEEKKSKETYWDVKIKIGFIKVLLKFGVIALNSVKKSQNILSDFSAHSGGFLQHKFIVIRTDGQKIRAIVPLSS